MPDVDLIHEILLRLIDKDDSKLLDKAIKDAEAHVNEGAAAKWSEERRVAEYRSALRAELGPKVRQAYEVASVIGVQISRLEALNRRLEEYSTSDLAELAALVRASGRRDSADAAAQIEYFMGQLKGNSAVSTPVMFLEYFSGLAEENRYLPAWIETKTTEEKRRISNQTIHELRTMGL